MARTWVQSRRRTCPPGQLVGNLALVGNFGSAPAALPAAKATPEGSARFWFADWRISGSKVDAHDDRAFGPILFTQYTLSGGVLKMTAQMPPLGAQDSQTVRLQVRKGGELVHDRRRADPRRGAHGDVSHRELGRRARRAVSPGLHADAQERPERRSITGTGTIRRDPVDQPVITVADVSCNIHAGVSERALRRQHGEAQSRPARVRRRPVLREHRRLRRHPRRRSTRRSSTTSASGTCTAGPGAS